MIQGPWQSGILLLPCSLPHFRFGFGPIIRPHLRMGPFFHPHNLSPSCQPAYLLDRLSLCLMHGCYVTKCIADQKVKTYIGFVAGEAAPYPPPSDPLLATPDRNRILLPRRRSTGLVQILLPCIRAITCDLASALSSGSNFGWSLFFCAIAPSGRRSISMRICMAALPIVRLCRSRAYRILHSTAGFVVNPPPPRSAAPAKDRTAPPIPSGGAFFVPQDLRANGTSCPADFSPDTHSSRKSSENNGLSPARHLQPRTRRPGDSHGCHHLDIHLCRLSGLWLDQ